MLQNTPVEEKRSTNAEKRTENIPYAEPKSIFRDYPTPMQNFLPLQTLLATFGDNILKIVQYSIH